MARRTGDIKEESRTKQNDSRDAAYDQPHVLISNLGEDKTAGCGLPESHRIARRAPSYPMIGSNTNTNTNTNIDRKFKYKYQVTVLPEQPISDRVIRSRSRIICLLEKHHLPAREKAVQIWFYCELSSCSDSSQVSIRPNTKEYKTRINGAKF